MGKRKYIQGFDGKSERETTWKTYGEMDVKVNMHLNTFAASYLNTQGLNNSCLKSRQRRP